MKLTHTVALAAAALLLTSATAAEAQKMKPMAMPATSKAHMSKADKDAAKDARDAAKDARKSDERAEKAAKDELKDQPKALLKGIKLTKEEKASVKAIEKKTDEQIEALEKQAKADEKAGTPTTGAAQKLDAVRDGERAELRAALTPEHQTRFDQNVAGIRGKH
jgi:hypothetical protein